MRILMVGAGGVGGYFGGRMLASGRDVTFVARGAHLQAIRDQGLHIESPRGDLVLEDVRAVSDPGSAGPMDLVLLAVKMGDLQSALEAIAPVVGDETTVVPLQNGVEAVGMAIETFGLARVLGGVVLISAAITAPGRIRQVGDFAKIQLGEPGGGRRERLEHVADALTVDGIEVVVSDDIERAIWEKFVILAAMSASTAASRSPIGVLRDDPECRAWLVELIGEVAAVARAEGIALDSGFEDAILARIDGLPGEIIASMAHDLRMGKPLELDWLSGAVVRLGRSHGQDTPAHRHVVAALRPHRAGGTV